MTKDQRKGDRHTAAPRVIRLARELWEALDERAERDGIDRTEAVRQAVKDWTGRPRR